MHSVARPWINSGRSEILKGWGLGGIQLIFGEGGSRQISAELWNALVFLKLCLSCRAITLWWKVGKGLWCLEGNLSPLLPVKVTWDWDLQTFYRVVWLYQQLLKSSIWSVKYGITSAPRYVTIFLFSSKSVVCIQCSHCSYFVFAVSPNQHSFVSQQSPGFPFLTIIGKLKWVVDTACTKPTSSYIHVIVRPHPQQRNEFSLGYKGWFLSRH